jgi:hypothetical protein
VAALVFFTMFMPETKGYGENAQTLAERRFVGERRPASHGVSRVLPDGAYRG